MSWSDHAALYALWRFDGGQQSAPLGWADAGLLGTAGQLSKAPVLMAAAKVAHRAGAKASTGPDGSFESRVATTCRLPDLRAAISMQLLLFVLRTAFRHEV